MTDMSDETRPPEMCCECDEATGHAGRGEDSRYCDVCDTGPLCDACAQGHEVTCEEIIHRMMTEDE